MAREAATKMNDAQATELRQVLDDLGRQMSDPEAYLGTDPSFTITVAPRGASSCRSAN